MIRGWTRIDINLIFVSWLVKSWKCLVGLPSPSNINFHDPDISGKEFWTKKALAFSSHNIFGEFKSLLFSAVINIFYDDNFFSTKLFVFSFFICFILSQTSNAVKSALLTPGILDASPKLVGFILFKFSRASKDKVSIWS